MIDLYEKLRAGAMLQSDCPFCKKISDGSAHPYGSESYIFEPLNPVVPGHTLFIPAVHTEKSQPAIQKTMGPIFSDAVLYGESQGEDYNLIINVGKDASQTIDHLHVHYVPRKPQDGLKLPWAPIGDDH